MESSHIRRQLCRHKIFNQYLFDALSAIHETILYLFLPLDVVVVAIILSFTYFCFHRHRLPDINTKSPAQACHTQSCSTNSMDETARHEEPFVRRLDGRTGTACEHRTSSENDRCRVEVPPPVCNILQIDFIPLYIMHPKSSFNLRPLREQAISRVFPMSNMLQKHADL